MSGRTEEIEADGTERHSRTKVNTRNHRETQKINTIPRKPEKKNPLTSCFFYYHKQHSEIDSENIYTNFFTLFIS